MKPKRVPSNGGGGNVLSRWGANVAPSLLVASGALSIIWSQPSVAAQYQEVKQTSDTYGLPEPEQLKAMSLGYRSAIADFIYAHVLVSYGLHFQEQRRFTYIGQYLDAINALDPGFERPYLFADTLLTLLPVPPLQSDYHKAREVVLRGTKALPYHQDMWITAGQYIAYLAAPHLETEAEQEAWRTEGAQLLAHACQLASGDENAPRSCLGAARYLNMVGRVDEIRRMMNRTLATNDDENTRGRALAVLSRWVGEAERERIAARHDDFRRLWKQDPQTGIDRLLLLGPRFDVVACAGRTRGCGVTWRQWGADFRAAP